MLQASEYAEVGKVVAYVSVNDPDSGENGVTVCRLNTKDFELQPLNNQGQYKASHPPALREEWGFVGRRLGFVGKLWDFGAVWADAGAVWADSGILWADSETFGADGWVLWADVWAL